MTTGIWPNTLEEMPEGAYFAYQNQWRTPNMKKFFQSQFSNILNQYMGLGAQQMMGGNIPTQRFTDFLSNYNWGQQFQEQVPRQDFSRYNPWTRWMV